MQEKLKKINVQHFLFRKAVKKGFDFTLMVVGESGLGKSTLINSMFLTNIYGEAAADPAAKGQLFSEFIYEVIVSTKMQTKNYRDFCPKTFGKIETANAIFWIGCLIELKFCVVS